MWEAALKEAVGYGLFAVLFVTLLYWVLKENKHREDRYLAIIETLGQEVVERLDALEKAVERKDGHHG